MSRITAESQTEILSRKALVSEARSLIRGWKSRTVFAGTAALTLLAVCNPGLASMLGAAAPNNNPPDFEAALDCATSTNHKIRVNVTSIGLQEKGVIIGIQDPESHREVYVKPEWNSDGSEYQYRSSSPVYPTNDRVFSINGQEYLIKAFLDPREGYAKRPHPTDPTSIPSQRQRLDPLWNYGKGDDGVISSPSPTPSPYIPPVGDFIAQKKVQCAPAAQ